MILIDFFILLKGVGGGVDGERGMNGRELFKGLGELEGVDFRNQVWVIKPRSFPLPHANHSRPIPIQQRLHTPTSCNLPLHFFNPPPSKPVPSREILILKRHPPTANYVIERQAEFLVGVGFWIVGVDPTGETGADEGGLGGDEGPGGLVLELGVDEGHFLGAGDALVPVGAGSVSGSWGG